VKNLARGIVDFVVGDDIWIAVAVVLLLAATAAVGRVGSEAWWLLALGVPALLWSSLRRAQRRVKKEIADQPL
jgi:hypothetical protein